MGVLHTLNFVKATHQHDDVYTFSFTKPETISHRAGQHGLFIVPGLYRPHPFTLSNAPEEQYVSFTTHVGTASRYKKALLRLKKDDKVWLMGPVLWFTFKKRSSRYVFLAQGIGITPFISMLTHAHTARLPVEIRLIHVAAGEHTFAARTKKYATHAVFVSSPDAFRAAVALEDPRQHFYISGSPAFVRSTKKILLAKGVSRRNCTTDSFLGY